MSWFGKKDKVVKKRPRCKYGCAYLSKAGTQKPVLMKVLYVSQKNDSGATRFTRIGLICPKCNHVEFDRRKNK